MALEFTPTTELQAVNVMLGTLGQSPISSLPSESSTSALVDAVIAENLLHEISRDVQTRGWHFNTNIDYPIAPDVNGYLKPPSNTLQIDVTDCYQHHDLVHRGEKLWDVNNNTFVMDETVKFNIVVFLPFTELPEAPRRYITIRAARTFQERMLGSDTLHVYSEKQEIDAKALIKGADHKTKKPSIFDKGGTLRTIRRR